MTRRRRCPAVITLLLAACAAAPPLPAPGQDHPACPTADAAPEQAPGTTLVMPERTPPAAGEPRRGH